MSRVVRCGMAQVLCAVPAFPTLLPRPTCLSLPQGSATGLGACRRSCGECTVCAAGDAACRRENRLRAGFLPIHDPDFF